MEYALGLIGGGNMAEAILHGLLQCAEWRKLRRQGSGSQVESDVTPWHGVENIVPIGVVFDQLSYCRRWQIPRR